MTDPTTAPVTVRPPHVRPAEATVRTLTVLTVSRPSPGFVRVTLRGDGAAAFTDRGLDQWVRLFLPPTPDAPLVLPDGGAEGWYSRWQALPEAQRPTVRNYTIRQARRRDDGWDLDVDLVVHRTADGTVEGVAAAWALAVRPGDQVGVLEQGVLFRGDPTTDDGLLVLSDESGLPGVEAVLRSLPAGFRAEVAVEVASAADVRDLPSPADLQVHWLVRQHGEGQGDGQGEHGPAAGAQLLSHLRAWRPSAGAYLYAVGETGFTGAVQKAAAAAGMRPEQVDACAYWNRRRNRA